MRVILGDRFDRPLRSDGCSWAEGGSPSKINRRCGRRASGHRGQGSVVRCDVWPVPGGVVHERRLGCSLRTSSYAACRRGGKRGGRRGGVGRRSLGSRGRRRWGGFRAGCDVLSTGRRSCLRLCWRLLACWRCSRASSTESRKAGAPGRKILIKLVKLPPKPRQVPACTGHTGVMHTVQPKPLVVIFFPRQEE